MKFLVVILFVLGTMSISFALDCYLCVAPLDSDCAKATPSSMAIQTCREYNDTSAFSFSKDDEMAKLNEQYAGRRIVSECISVGVVSKGRSYFTRGCGYIFKGVDICKFIAKHVDQVKSCKACDSNLCNNQ